MITKGERGAVMFERGDIALTMSVGSEKVLEKNETAKETHLILIGREKGGTIA